MEYLLHLTAQIDVHLIGHSVYRETSQRIDRMHKDYELIVVYQGKLCCEIDSNLYHLSEGDTCLIPPGVPNSQFCENTCCRFFYVHFSIPSTPITSQLRQKLLKEMIQRPKINSNVYILPHMDQERTYLLLADHMDCGPYKDEISTLFAKALIERNHNNVGRVLLISAYVMHILILLSRHYMNGLLEQEQNTGEQKQFVQEALRYIQAHYQEPIQISELSRSLYVSQQYLSRMFRAELGMSPIKYINKLRIEQAKELIQSTSLTFSEIAVQVGFENLYYFSRIFKQYEGFPPSTYKMWLNSKSNE